MIIADPQVNIDVCGLVIFSLLDTDELPGGPPKKALWRPSLAMTSVLKGVIEVLQEPCPESGANLVAAKMFCR